jgi:hypothetical protein
MEYGKIIAVTGLPGLYELISSKNDGAIVRSLEDQSTKFVSSRVHNFSHLESIEVFTVRDNVNLTEVFFAMEKEGGKVPDGKDAAELKKYFQKVYPDLDFERVYNSDLKKMAKWFEVLKKNDIEIKLTQQPEAEEEASTEEAPAEEAAEAPKKKAKAATKEEKPASAKAEDVEAEEKPKKVAKKKAEPKAEKEDAEKAPAKKAAAKKAPAKKK